MSHEVETMAYTNEKPWHGLGVPVSNDLTPEQMLAAASLDWEVAKMPSFIRIGEVGKPGNKQVPTGQMALVRLSDNSVLSPNVGPDWEPLQNREAFEFFHDFVEAGDMTMETAGSLRGGRVIWGLAKTTRSFTLFKGDTIEQYMLLSSSHAYGRSTVVDLTPIRVVCNNTLTLALNSKSKNSVAISHRSKFDAAKVKELMGIAASKMDRYQEAAKVLGAKKAAKDDVLEFFKTIFPVHVAEGKESKREISKNAKIALDVLDNQPGAEFAAGTWWQAFNAVTYTTDHLLCRDEDTRLFNSWLGSTRDTKIKALEKALEFASK